jgi:SPX domain protein involved in polyphosphate accumulation
MKYITVSLLVLFVLGLMIPNAFAENVPNWIKNNAGWWATDQIDDSSFLQGIQFLIKEGIMVIPYTETTESSRSQEIPAC